MKITILMVNPHDPNKPTCLSCTDCKTLDEAVDSVFFFMACCQIIKVQVVEQSVAVGI